MIVVGVVAVGGIGAFATWGLFVTLNGALDSGPATQRSYTVAEFHEDCGGARAKDKSYYLLEPRGMHGGDEPIQARVNCSDDEARSSWRSSLGRSGSHGRLGITRGSLGHLWWCTRTGIRQNAMVGTDGLDTIVGLGGNDTIRGLAAPDRLTGDGNAATLPGDDELFGGDGSDHLFGGADLLSGEEGADEFAAAFPVGDGTDTIEGGPGNDTVYAVEGQSDVIDCGPGRDSVEFDAGLDSVKHCEIKYAL